MECRFLWTAFVTNFPLSRPSDLIILFPALSNFARLDQRKYGTNRINEEFLIDAEMKFLGLSSHPKTSNRSMIRRANILAFLFIRTRVCRYLFKNVTSRNEYVFVTTFSSSSSSSSFVRTPILCDVPCELLVPSSYSLSTRYLFLRNLPSFEKDVVQWTQISRLSSTVRTFVHKIRLQDRPLT